MTYGANDIIVPFPGGRSDCRRFSFWRAIKPDWSHQASRRDALLSEASSICVAVTGVVAIAVVIAMALVATKRFEIDLVQNNSQQIIVDAAGQY